MSDNIPFEIQMEIIEKVYDVKSLIRFRSVSKPWKCFIDSSEFIKGYSARHTQPNSYILSLTLGSPDDLRYICLVDDDIETFKVQQELAPSLKQYLFSLVVGVCHGFLCFYGYNEVDYNEMVVIWNPSIGKSFGIVVPNYDDQPVEIGFGFGVCPVTSDPIVVKLLCTDDMPWNVEVFTLSSGVWNVIPSGNLPRQSIRLNNTTQVVIDRFIYWGAREWTFDDDFESTTTYMVVSFDLITKEFKAVDLPGTLTNELIPHMSLSVCKLKGSLVVYGYIEVEEASCCCVWVMEHDFSFRKLFSIGAPVNKILGFSKSGEPIVESPTKDLRFTTLDVYDPSSQQIKNLGISGRGSFFMDSYKESLLLLDHSDLDIYSNNN